jgi:uncharacterized protein (DUF924 family)
MNRPVSLLMLLAATTARAEPPLRPYEGDLMMPIPACTRLATLHRASNLLDFWEAAGPALWFAKDPEFDRRFRERFLADHEAAARGELAYWLSSAEGALALVILLDQFPRNAFRDTPRMYDTDALARKFLLLPFAHSEDLADQEKAVALARRIGTEDLGRAEHHRDIVRRFGRFPHRNRILGRQSSPEELQYLANGGYQG